MTRHPYMDYEKHPIWAVVEKGIADLVSNGDLSEMTARQYVVGFCVI